MLKNKGFFPKIEFLKKGKQRECVHTFPKLNIFAVAKIIQFAC